MTTFPHDFYPGTEWRSMMLWGADEIPLADEALGAPAARVRADLSVAAFTGEDGLVVDCVEGVMRGIPASGSSWM